MIYFFRIFAVIKLSIITFISFYICYISHFGYIRYIRFILVSYHFHISFIFVSMENLVPNKNVPFDVLHWLRPAILRGKGKTCELNMIASDVRKIQKNLLKGEIINGYNYNLRTEPIIFGGLIRESIQNGAVCSKTKLQTCPYIEDRKYHNVNVFCKTRLPVTAYRLETLCEIMRARYVILWSGRVCAGNAHIIIKCNNGIYDLVFNTALLFDYSINCLAMDVNCNLFSRHPKITVNQAIQEIKRRRLIPLAPLTSFSYSRRVQMINQGYTLDEYEFNSTYLILKLLCYRIQIELPNEMIDLIMESDSYC